MKGVNLIPLPLRLARSHRRRTRRWALACAAYAAALLMTCAVIRGLWSADCLTLNGEIASTGRRIDDANRELSLRRAQLAEMQEQSRVSQAISDQSDWSALLGAVSTQMDDDLVLREVRLGAAPGNEARNVADTLTAPRRYELSIHGVSRTSAGVSKFVAELEKMQFFDEVKLVRTSRETFLNVPATGFEVETSFGQQKRSAK